MPRMVLTEDLQRFLEVLQRVLSERYGTCFERTPKWRRAQSLDKIDELRLGRETMLYAQQLKYAGSNKFIQACSSNCVMLPGRRILLQQCARVENEVVSEFRSQV